MARRTARTVRGVLDPAPTPEADVTVRANEHGSVVVHLSQISPVPLGVYRLAVVADPDRSEDQVAVGCRLECGRAPWIPARPGQQQETPSGIDSSVDRRIPSTESQACGSLLPGRVVGR